MSLNLGTPFYSLKCNFLVFLLITFLLGYVFSINYFLLGYVLNINYFLLGYVLNI